MFTHSTWAKCCKNSLSVADPHVQQQAEQPKQQKAEWALKVADSAAI